MNRRQPPGIWVTNHLANPLMRPLLHSPARHRLGRHLALIRYRGRRTGRSYELPVQYARDGDRVWILPGAPGRTTWWRNLRGGAAVDLVLAGHDRHGRAVCGCTLGISHLVCVPGAPAVRAWGPATEAEGPRSPLVGRRGGGTALLATYSSARPGSADRGRIAAAASRSAATRIAAIWLLACCRTAAASRSAASCMALTSAQAQCLMLAALPSARFRIRHACQSESVSRNRPGRCGYPASCG
jgi:hypothetical protein